MIIRALQDFLRGLFAHLTLNHWGSEITVFRKDLISVETLLAIKDIPARVYAMAA